MDIVYRGNIGLILFLGVLICIILADYFCTLFRIEAIEIGKIEETKLKKTTRRVTGMYYGASIFMASFIIYLFIERNTIPTAANIVIGSFIILILLIVFPNIAAKFDLKRTITHIEYKLRKK